MKTEDLEKQGLTKDQIAFVMAENGKDLKKLQNENGALSADRDAWKGKAEQAEGTLKSFEGIDPAKIQSELAEWKKKAEEAEKNAQAQIYERDFSDALKSEMEGYKFTSSFAKKAIMEEIKAAGLKLKNGKILGLSDLMEQIKKSDESAFVDEHQAELEAGKARFTQPRKYDGGSGFGSLTKKDIMDIKDPSERQAAIASNLGLFKKGD